MAKILIVDDEPDMRLAVRNVLKLAGTKSWRPGRAHCPGDLVRENVDLMLDIATHGRQDLERKAIKTRCVV